MAYDLSGVDVFFLVKELKSLEGAKVDKITQIDRKLFTIRFFADKKKPVLRILVPEILNITEQKYESPLLPLGFCSFLRKYLQNTKLVSVDQKAFERIIIFEFESFKFGKLSLIIELFKPGNMILCKNEELPEGEESEIKQGDSKQGTKRDKESKHEAKKSKESEQESKQEIKQEDNKHESKVLRLIILNALERQSFKSRNIGAREEYVFPPERNNPVFICSENSSVLKKIIDESGKTLGKALATELSLGGKYAEEIVVRAGLDKNASELSSAEIEKLKKTFQTFFSQTPDCKGLNGKVFPVNMSSLETESSFSSFNQGLDSVKIETTAEVGKTSEQKKKKSKTASLLSIQEKRIKELEKEIDENQKTGEFIYEHYQEFQKLIDAVHEMRAKNSSFEEIEEILSKNKRFKKLDKAKKTLLMSWSEK